jgi:hypothetical protein
MTISVEIRSSGPIPKREGETFCKWNEGTTSWAAISVLDMLSVGCGWVQSAYRLSGVAIIIRREP